jgi:hypothetical protein
MRSYALLAALPLVMAAPAPAPVAAPLPVPIPAPNPQSEGHHITNPIKDLLHALICGGLSLDSLATAVPAIISDVGNILDSAGEVTRKSILLNRIFWPMSSLWF